MTQDLFNALTNGIAVFTFVKKNGETRKAIGTLNARVIARYSPMTSVRDLTIAENSNRYFDLEVCEWRRIASVEAHEHLIATVTDITEFVRFIG